jgi:sugar-specific transcriptional regulator TrmB
MLTGLEKSLEKMGLSEKESTVYISALELGKFSVLALSGKTGIKRPTCYLILDELIKKGLISTFPKAKKVIYVAEHPNALLKNAADSYALAKDLMPELQRLINTESEKPILKVYVGQKGIQNIFDDILSDGKDFYQIVSVSDLVVAVGKEFLDVWILKRVAKKMKSVAVRIKDGEMNFKLYENTPDTPRTIRYAPSGFKMPYTMFIYGKKVAFISTKKELFGFIVESADMALSMKMLFDVVWKTSSEN